MYRRSRTTTFTEAPASIVSSFSLRAINEFASESVEISSWISKARTDVASSESIARTYERVPGVELIAFSSFAFMNCRYSKHGANHWSNE